MFLIAIDGRGVLEPLYSMFHGQEHYIPLYLEHRISLVSNLPFKPRAERLPEHLLGFDQFDTHLFSLYRNSIMAVWFDAECQISVRNNDIFVHVDTEYPYGLQARHFTHGNVHTRHGFALSPKARHPTGSAGQR